VNFSTKEEKRRRKEKVDEKREGEEKDEAHLYILVRIYI
jgi:hypothetical protein